ncbi:twin-arginine translocase TatA/TatE family subunit [Microbacterium thalli]|uniref:Twin-arginine translocase TatA/TatE family subunit n=1 Tax=Microbacterium thalli TaxID=3027921 RepID=A0ABT5SJF5_9MICO|nr:twin-arginine translocase TatA/TatE family subunit [Microbacterium thalli]MDD7929558.1 twin-arginine translocase TatA/TatE family subunit [Microbacterium thalli]MDD7962934.1 twin-arginine translocase TatA/TatE family subunit [Microbacterium thalli]MDN8548573.1 twin-arginine translocase TatA/TatE family subunit [Microbacterium thalli]
MFFGLDGDKLILIGVAAVLLLGPERLPQLAEALARFTVRAREWVNGAKDRVKDEMGPEFSEVEWRKLDPRQYDPRRIIRDALLEDAPVPAVRAAAAGAAITTASAVGMDAAGAAHLRFDRDAVVPFDDEAT